MALSGTANTISVLDGLFKIKYAKQLVNLVPNWSKIQKDIAFSPAGKTGELFRQPVLLKMEHGVTYAASGAGPFALDSVNFVSAVTKKADVTGSQMVLRAAIDYEASFSGEGAEDAFENATSLMVRNMWESVHKRVELDCLYGQTPLDDSIATSGETNIQIDATNWADGIWVGMEGIGVQVAPTGSANQARSGVGYVTAINMATRALTISPGITGLVATDVLWLATQVPTTPATAGYNSMAGIEAITNPALWGPSRKLFAIDPTGITLWAATTATCTAISGGTTFNFAALQKAIVYLVNRGLDTDVVCYVAPTVWAQMMSDQMALRRFDAQYSSGKLVSGAQEIEFYAQNGKITVKCHPMLRPSVAYILAPKLWKRIGATDVTFNRNNMGGSVSRGGDSFFKELENLAGYELRCYSHQAIFTEAPAKAMRITGIA